MSLLFSLLSRRARTRKDPPRVGSAPGEGSESLDIDALYRNYAGMVLRRARRFYSQQEAEEVVHEVFVRAIEKAHTFRAEASPSTWLYQMTTNHCLNRLRNSKRRQAARLIQGDNPWELPAAPADGETTAFLEQIWTRIDGELLQVGVHYYMDGMSHAEIARLMGVSRRTVGNRITTLQDEVRKLSDGPQEGES